MAGFSLFDVTLSIVIVVLVGWVCVEASVITSRTAIDTVHDSQLDLRAHRVLARVARELQEARLDTLLPDPVKPLDASTLSYRCAEIDAAGLIVWGEYRRLELVPSDTDPSDGLDNDGDGLTDEHELRLVRDVGLSTECTTTLVRGVMPLLSGEQYNALDDNENGLIDESGFSITRVGGILEIRISLQGLDAERQVTTRTAETSVWLRN